jgi:hypothetical protein
LITVQTGYAETIVIKGSEKPFVRSRYRWKDNNIMDLRKVEFEKVNWTYLAQFPIADSCEHNDPLSFVMNREFLVQLSNQSLLKKEFAPRS